VNRGRDYLDFDLLLERDGSEHWARVLSSPAGEGSRRFEIPFRPGELERSVLRVASLTARHTRAVSQRAVEARDIGRRLYAAVFAQEIGSLYQHSLSIAQSEDKGLRLLISTADRELASLPWELLYVPGREQFMGLSTQTPVLRYVDSPEPRTVRPAGGALSVLVAISSAEDLPPIDVDKERQILLEALHSAASPSAAHEVDLVFLERTTLVGLQRALLDKTDIVHFTGHAGIDPGIEEPFLVLEDESGRSQRLEGHRLAALLADNQDLRLVVLDLDAMATAVGSALPGPAMAEALVRSGVASAIGLQFPLSDQGMLAFVQGFYAAMSSGLPVDASVSEARKALAVASSLDTVDWAAPVLYTRIRSEAALASPALAEADADLDADIERLLQCHSVDDIADVRLTASGRTFATSAPLIRGRFATITDDVRAAAAQQSVVNRRSALAGVAMGLNELSSQLDRDARADRTTSSSGYQGTAARWAEVAISWLTIVRAELMRLDHQVERLQAVESPYIVGTPLRRDAAIFVGRADIGRRLERLIVAEWTPPLLLYGQRRMGKTSLLYNLGRLLPTAILPLFVDLQGPPSQSDGHSGFLYHLADAMARAASGSQGAVFRGPPREAFSGDAFSTFYAWLDDLDSYAEGRTLLLMLDEFEALDRAFDSRRIKPDEVLDMIRHLIQHRARFKLLLAGSHTLDQFQRWSSYLINVQVLKVGYLSDMEARKLVEAPVPDFPLVYDSAATTRVIQLTRGHPYLVQLLCNEIVALKNEGPAEARRWATVDDVDAAVPAALDSGSLFFTDVEHGQVGERGRQVLRAMSRRGEGMTVDEAELSARFDGDLHTTLMDLRKRDFIEPADGGHRFQVELIRQWFARSAAE
jgi:CHAT domain/AAA domain